MNRSLASLLLLISLPAVSTEAGVQFQLAFTTQGTETTRSGSSGSSLATITPEDIAIVEPVPGAPYSAETYADHLNWNTLAGDGDLDSFYYEGPLSGQIDALYFCGYFSIRDLRISTKLPLPCAGSGIIEPGDVAAILPSGMAQHLIDDTQIRLAFDIPVSVLSFDVDAVWVDPYGHILLSFEEDMYIQGGSTLLKDGAVAWIQNIYLTWNWDDCRVVSVIPNTGQVALSEARVDSMCVNANAADASGAAVGSIGDLDGLTYDPTGGYFTSDDGYPFLRDMLFCGERLTGGGILSTFGSGSIAEINLVPMATPFGFGATDGTQVGLDPGSVLSLNGLDMADDACRFILDSSTPVLLTAGPLNITAGGADPFQPVLILVTVPGVSGPGGVQPSVVHNNPCLPEWYLHNIAFLVFSDALGIVDLTAFYGGNAPPGSTIVLQGASPKSGIYALSLPITLQF